MRRMPSVATSPDLTVPAVASGARPRVLSGIQPTADSFHFGNYLGATRQWVDLQREYQPFFFIADLHAITVEQDPGVLRERTLRAAARSHRSRRSFGSCSTVIACMSAMKKNGS